MPLINRAIRRPKQVPEAYHGYDLSLTGTGIVVLNAKSEVIYSETLKNKLRGMPRLHHIRDRIEWASKEFPPTNTCIEGYAMGSRAGQAFSIGELGGVVKLALHERGIEFYLVPPTRVKKFITGGGKAEKDMIILKVYQRWGWEAADNNQADAYGLAMIAKELIVSSDNLNKAQREVIHDILHPPTPKGKK